MLVLHGGLTQDAGEHAHLLRALTQRQSLRGLVVAIASGNDALAWRVEDAYRAVGATGFVVVSADLVPEMIAEIRVLHLAGGSAPLLARLLREGAFAASLAAARERGLSIVAESAGAMALGQVTFGCPDGDWERTASHPGLGWLTDTVVEAHYEQPIRRLRLQRALERGEASLGLGIDSGTALVTCADHPISVVGSGHIHILQRTAAGPRTWVVGAGDRVPLLADAPWNLLSTTSTHGPDTSRTAA